MRVFLIIVFIGATLGQKEWNQTHVLNFSQPNNACMGVHMSFTNHLGPNALIRGFWLTHKASSSEKKEIIFSADTLKDGETSETLHIESGYHASDYWSFAAMIEIKGQPLVVAYVMKKSCQLQCPEDDYSLINVDIQCTSTPCEKIKMTIPMKSSGCTQTAEFIQPDRSADAWPILSNIDVMEPSIEEKVFLPTSFPNEDCHDIGVTLKNEYSFTLGGFYAHRASSPSSFSNHWAQQLPIDIISQPSVGVLSRAGDFDYWSLAIVGIRRSIFDVEPEPYVAYRLNRSCQLYCPKDNRLDVVLTLSQGKKLIVPLKSSGCSFSVNFETP